MLLAVPGIPIGRSDYLPTQIHPLNIRTEIAKLGDRLLRGALDEDVARFDIAMHRLVRVMEVFDGL